jgi:plastocyanin
VCDGVDGVFAPSPSPIIQRGAMHPRGDAMSRTFRIVMLAAAASLVIATTALAGPAAKTTALVGSDGPGFTVSLAKGGHKVTTLKAGKYAITVQDKSAIHNFHLFGPGVNKVVTSVPFVGTKKLTVTLKKGTYTYQCDVHFSSGMKATFKVS